MRDNFQCKIKSTDPRDMTTDYFSENKLYLNNIINTIYCIYY